MVVYNRIPVSVTTRVNSHMPCGSCRTAAPAGRSGQSGCPASGWASDCGDVMGCESWTSCSVLTLLQFTLELHAGWCGFKWILCVFVLAGKPQRKYLGKGLRYMSCDESHVYPICISKVVIVCAMWYLIMRIQNVS